MLTDEEILQIILDCPNGRIAKTVFTKLLREKTGRKIAYINHYIEDFNTRQEKRNKLYRIRANGGNRYGFYYIEEVTK